MPRVNWKQGVVNELIRGKDGFARASRRQVSKDETSRLMKKLFPLEVSGSQSDSTNDNTDEQHEDTTHRSTRPNQNSSRKAQKRILKWITNIDDHDEEGQQF